MRPLIPACLLGLAAVLTGGCRDRQISSYRAPKDPAAAAPAAAAPAREGALPADHPPVGGAPAGGDMAATPVPTGSNALAWTAPAGWIAKPLGSMRKGSFAIKDDSGGEADLSILAFPGDTGGFNANVNRWRGQVGLDSLPEAEIPGVLEHLNVNGLHFEIVNFAGNAGGKPVRLIGAILPRSGETWFFKLLGPDALVGGQLDTFRNFLRTVHTNQP